MAYNKGATFVTSRYQVDGETLDIQEALNEVIDNVGSLDIATSTGEASLVEAIESRVIYVNSLSELEQTTALSEGVQARLGNTSFSWEGGEWKAISPVDVVSLGASDLNSGESNQAAFDAAVSYGREIVIPSGVSLACNGLVLGSHQKLVFEADAWLQPGEDNVEVVKLAGDYSTVHNLRIKNPDQYLGCTGLALTPSAALIRTGQRYNKVYQMYIDGVDKGVVLQCGDFVIAEGFASGCWYNGFYGGEIRNITQYGIHFKDGLNTDSGVTTQDPATSNRNEFIGVSQHFVEGAGIKIDSGETNTFLHCNIESCNTSGFIAIDIAEQAAGSPPNQNSHNRFISCGTESVTQSLRNLNNRTVFVECVLERNSGDVWSDVAVSEVSDPSRAPYITPLLEREDYDSGRGKVTGKGYIKATRGLEYCTNTGDEPSSVFSVHDKNHNWQELDLPSLIGNASLVGDGWRARYQKSGNFVDFVVRARVDSVTGVIEINLPSAINFADDTYAATGDGVYAMTWPISIFTPSVSIGHAQVSGTSKIRILNSDSWPDSSDFELSIRYRVSDSV